MKIAKIILACAVAAGIVNPVSAQEQEKTKFSIAPCGRILMDGAFYTSPNRVDFTEEDGSISSRRMFKEGLSIPDVRLGVKMAYGNWKAHIDIGYAYSKIGLKDVFFEYDFNDKHLIRFGSFIHQFGLQSSTSSSMKITMEEPFSNAIFNDPRQLGVMYQYFGDKFMGSASFHVEPKVTSLMLTPNQFTQEGYGVRSRLVARPVHENGKVVQVGLSGAFGTPQNNGNPDFHDSFTFAADFPTSVARQTALATEISNSMNLWKCSPELLLAYGPLALESQYYYVQVNRRDDLKAFKAQGAYATVRGLILGGDYGYSMTDGGLATPRPGSLEAVASYNYTKLSDPKSGFFGGNLNDASLTFSYYVNKYMIARLHYSYTHTWNRAGHAPVSVNGFMARFQVIF